MKITHNKKLFWIIIVLIIILGFLIYFIVNNENEEYGNNENGNSSECQIDSDCVPAECCHADKCINKNEKPDCDGIFCSQVCSSSLDCGAGHCGCINEKCEVIAD